MITSVEVPMENSNFKPESSHIVKCGRAFSIEAPTALRFFFGGCGYGKKKVNY